LNIQRGRDHGLPGYNAIRQACGLRTVCDWEDMPKQIFLNDEGVTGWRKLKEIYEPLFIEPGGLDQDPLHLFCYCCSSHSVEPFLLLFLLLSLLLFLMPLLPLPFLR
jgi:hypothetical protein